LAAGKEELNQWWFFRTPTDNAGDNPSGTSFVERATTVRGWSLSIDSSSTKGTYKFPLTLSTRLLRHLGGADPGDGILRRIRQSEFALTYSPLNIDPKKDQSPGLDTSTSRMGTLAFKIPLAGTADIDDFDTFLNTELGKSTDKILPRFQDPANRNLLLPGTEEVVGQLIQQDFKSALDKVKQQLAGQLSVAAKVNYDWDGRDGQPDAIIATLAASKDGFQLGQVPTGLAASASNAWFQEDLPQRAFTRRRGGLGAEFTIKEGLSLAVQSVYDHYSGVGFTGISGISNISTKDDLSLVQVFKFKIFNGNKLELSVKEKHVNTSDIDVAIAIGAGFKLIG